MSRAGDRLGELAGVGDLGIELEGPPWLLGQRGVPLEAPENTLVSFERALEAGLDGLQYDVRVTAGGEPVVLRDARLERTTDGHGPVDEHGLPELFQLDAGGWFSKDFVGETVPHLDEVLELEEEPRHPPIHLIELHEPQLIGELARRLRQPHRPYSVRVASPRRDVCLELTDAGVPAMLLGARAEAEDLAFVRDARIAGYGTTSPHGWDTAAGGESWPCERWALGVDDADELFELCLRGVNGITSSEARRALAIRGLAALRRKDVDTHPVACEPLLVANQPAEDGGDWSGDWRQEVRIANPFPFPCRALVRVYVRRGVFETEGLPQSLDLATGEERTVAFRLRGGSWSPGGDPLLAVLYAWDAGPGRPAGRLLLDRSLQRERRVQADAITQRLEMLCESPGAPRATMTLRRLRHQLTVAVENAGGLEDPHVALVLDGVAWYGGTSLRVPLPEHFDDAPSGLAFSCGFHGRRPGGGATVLRRWAGGLPADPGTGAAGRLLPFRHA